MPSKFASLAIVAAACVGAVTSTEDGYATNGKGGGEGHRYGSSAGGNPCEGRPTLKCVLTSTASQTVEEEASQVFGAITFAPSASGGDCASTRIYGSVYNLEDDTPHGWHIHEYGDISAEDGKATGGHYNPEGVDHALPRSGYGRSGHEGDLGNIRPQNGTASVEVQMEIDTRNVVGLGLIVHAKEDDGGQPTGNAGARLAQCVLGIAKSD